MFRRNTFIEPPSNRRDISNSRWGLLVCKNRVCFSRHVDNTFTSKTCSGIREVGLWTEVGIRGSGALQWRSVRRIHGWSKDKW